MKVAVVATVCLFGLGVTDCVEQVDGSSATDIIDGRPEFGHPSVGYLRVIGHNLQCGATMVGKAVAVTAAHCLWNDVKLAIGFGKMGSGPEIKVVHAIPHPDRQIVGSYIKHDIAVLFLESDPGFPAVGIERK